MSLVAFLMRAQSPNPAHQMEGGGWWMVDVEMFHWNWTNQPAKGRDPSAKNPRRRIAPGKGASHFHLLSPCLW